MKRYFFIGLSFILGLLVLVVPLTVVRGGSSPKEIQKTQSRCSTSIILPDVDISVNDIVASGFNLPIQVANAGDGSNRLFVVEQTGKIRIIKNGSVLGTPFVDLGSLIVCCGERGLLGLAFHPDYSTNGYFFVNYTRASDGATVIARYTKSTGNPDLADPSSADILLTIPQPYTNHNGGQLLFNPVDGYLYIGLGDGGSGGDPLNSGQDINTLLGAMLRIDVTAVSTYTIPPDNPFVGVAGKDEIWAYGLRNPWRFSFDRANGDLYIGDVGQGLWEEISFQAVDTPGGVNFGWRCKEGTQNYNFETSCESLDLTDPIAEYSHSVGFSVTGGFIYRGSIFPNLVGRYFYADYVEGKIWSIYQTDPVTITWSVPELELDTGLNISAFGEDEGGEIYIADYSGGTIRHLVDVNNPTPDISRSKKKISSSSADPAEIITYTLWLTNSGGLIDQAVVMTDTVPPGLDYISGTLQSGFGIPDDSISPTLTWDGNLLDNAVMSITYQVQVTGLVTGSIINQAVIDTPGIDPLILYQSLSVPRSVLTTTAVDFTFPGTQPGGLTLGIQTSLDCDQCHSEPIYDRWRGSLMSQSGRDPIMWAALHIANHDAPNSGEFCLKCHTPKGWLDGRSHPPDGTGLDAEDISSGVGCALCHRMVDPVASSDDEAKDIDAAIRATLTYTVPVGFTGSGSMIVDPDDNRRGPFSFDSPLIYHSSYQTDFLRQTGEAVTRSRFCGTCHNVYNPVLSWDSGKGEYWPNPMDAVAPDFDGDSLFPIETTFDEWLYSQYAQGGVYEPKFAGEKADGIVETCQDCHMPRVTGYATDAAFNPVNRDCGTDGCLPIHTFVGGNTWVPELLQNPDWRLSAESESPYLDSTMLEAETMLGKAASVTVTLTTSGTGKIATVRVINQSGHKLPTGYPEGRQMWINLKGYDSNHNVVYESGAYNWFDGTLDRDADIKVDEAKQGITPDLAAVLGVQPGESFHFVLNNTVIKDNRIPPRGYTVINYDKPGLRPVGAVYADGQHWDDTVYSIPPKTVLVHATLYYQTSSSEYIDFLRTNGGVDGLALGALWDGSKSPPQVMASAWSDELRIYFPLIFGWMNSLENSFLYRWWNGFILIIS